MTDFPPPPADLSEEQKVAMEAFQALPAEEQLRRMHQALLEAAVQQPVKLPAIYRIHELEAENGGPPVWMIVHRTAAGSTRCVWDAAEIVGYVTDVLVAMQLDKKTAGEVLAHLRGALDPGPQLEIVGGGLLVPR